MVNSAVQKASENGLEQAIVRALDKRSVVLVGMMGAGKSSIGRRLAARLGDPVCRRRHRNRKCRRHVDSRDFEKHAEPYFRAGEARVIARLLDSEPSVLATGGGAVMDPRTRELIGEKGISVWLSADIDVLVKRTKRRTDGRLVEKIKELMPLRRAVLCAVQHCHPFARRAARYDRRRDHGALATHFHIAAAKEQTR